VNVFNTGRIFNVWTGSTALRFTTAGAPLAASHIRMLPMKQHLKRLLQGLHNLSLNETNKSKELNTIITAAENKGYRNNNNSL
jgi:hypothetical protein